MSGHWPPEWEDPDEYSGAGLPDGSSPDLGHPDLDLAEVTSFLASVHSPALPPSFEARISAAIAAEAAARATPPTEADATEAAGAPMAATGAGDAKGTVRSIDPEEFSRAAAVGGGPATSANRRQRRNSRASRGAAATSGPKGSRPDGRRRRLRMPSAQASGWLVVCCLVIAGFGYIFSHASMSSPSSSVDSRSAAAPAPAAGTAGSAAGIASSARTSDNGHESSGMTPDHTDLQPGFGGPGRLFYIKSGTPYQASALASQVKGEVSEAGGVYAALGGSVTPSASAPVNPTSATTPVYPSSSASAAGSTGYQASAALAGCVAAVTHDVKPTLVDQASYDGTPAYIIAVPTEAWVVGRGCTAADTHVIAQVPLKG